MAITKACINPYCEWMYSMTDAPPADCPDCKGASIVPDEIAMLRAKLVESETWRTELRQEMDAVKGRLDAVTLQRDELRKAAQDVLDAWFDDDGVESALGRLEPAVEFAR